MTTCPDRGRLEQLLDNRLVDTELDELEQHVEGCASCQQVLDELTDVTNRELDPALGASIARNADEPGLDVDPIGLTVGTTASADERVGRGLPIVAGYQIEEELGRGGMGVVSRRTTFD
jgi:eukaryotic-like serine/threonine-protein kinase